MIDCINDFVIDAVLEPIAEGCRWFLNRFNLGSIMFLCRDLTLDADNLVRFDNFYGSKTWIRGFPLVNSNGTITLFLFLNENHVFPYKKITKVNV